MVGGRVRGHGQQGRRSARQLFDVPEEEEVVPEDEVQQEEHQEQQEDEEEAEEVAEEALQIPRDDEGRIILHHTDRGLWFWDSKVVNGASNSFKQNYLGSMPKTWGDVSRAQKEAWLNNFRREFSWTPGIDHLVREEWNNVGKRRYRDFIYKSVKTKKAPKAIPGQLYTDYLAHREGDEFRHLSEQNRINQRGGLPEGTPSPNLATHYGGAMSQYRRLQKLKGKNQQTPNAVDLFLESHSKVTNGRRTFIKPKDVEYYNEYLGEMQKNPEAIPDEVWHRIVKGYKKGGVYGVGNAHEVYYTPPTTRRPPARDTYAPGLVRRLELDLEKERAENAARQAEREERDARFEEQQRILMERVAYLSGLVDPCNAGPRPRFDDRDPDHGGNGGGGASSVNPVC